MGDTEHPTQSDPMEKGEQPPVKKMELDPEGNPDAVTDESHQSTLASPATTETEVVKNISVDNGKSMDVTTTEVITDEIKPEEVKEEVQEELVELRVMYNKQVYPVKISLHKTVGKGGGLSQLKEVCDLKKMIEVVTKVSPALQKVLVKGANIDDVTLKSIKMTNGQKFLVIGSTIDEVMAVAKPPDAATLAKDDANGKSNTDSQNWCTLTQHRKIIDKGVPEDVMPGVMNDTDQLPPIPLHGMLSSKGAKVRLTFKLESDELWIGTKERTDKISISTIRSVVSQPITGFEHYHILAIQLGPTEASRFYVYWVPAQYIEAIKDVLGG